MSVSLPTPASVCVSLLFVCCVRVFACLSACVYVCACVSCSSNFAANLTVASSWDWSDDIFTEYVQFVYVSGRHPGNAWCFVGRGFA